MEENRLIQFVKDGLERHGGLFETVGEDLLETILPPDLAKKLGLREEQLLGFSPAYQQSPEVEYISYNSEVLERFVCLIEQEGLFSILLGSSDLYLKQKGLEKLVYERISFLNSTSHFLEKEESYAAYLLVNLKYMALSEEKQDGLFSVLVNEHTLSTLSAARLVEAEEASELRPIFSLDQIPPQMLKSQTLDKVGQRAGKVAEQRISKILADFEKSLTRRMIRDIERLTEYYQALVNQVEQKIRKKHLAGEEKEKEEARIQAIQLEYKRKVIDQQERYNLKVQVDWINALRIIIPIISLKYEIWRKQKSRSLSLIWNPLIKDLELPSCESCFEDVGSFSLCDEHLHLLCPACFPECPTCQKHFCRVCNPHGCPRCSKK